MELGLSSFSFGWRVGEAGVRAGCPLRLNSLLETTCAYGLKLLQIGDNLPVLELSKEEKEHARALMERYQIRLELGMRGLTPENLRSYLDEARFFRSRLIRVVIDQGSYEPDIPTIVSILRSFAGELEAEQIQLSIENLDRLSAYEFEEVIQKTGSPQVGICFDTANSYGAGEGIEQTLQVLLPYISNLHVKDFSIRRLQPHGMGFLIEGTPAGQGMLQIPRLLEMVSKQHPDIHCILETWTPPCENDVETCEKETRICIYPR